MPGHDVIVIGASAGGVEPLMHLARQLPADLPAAVLVCLHVPPSGGSVLPSLLDRTGSLPARHATEGEAITPGNIYVAPPDRHLLICRDRVHLTRGPRENGHRPAVDTLFRSAAYAYRQRVVGVILSGSLDDGAAGLSVIKTLGGVAIVQDPDEALFPGMPLNALQNLAVDHILSIREMPGLLVELAREPVRDWAEAEIPEEMENELQVAERDMEGTGDKDRPGRPSVYTCPECHGTLWEVREGSVVRYRCRTGHAFSSDSLLSEQTQSLEAALWTALRAIEEKEDLAKRLTEHARARGHARAHAQFEAQVQEAAAHAGIIRQVLRESRTAGPGESAVETSLNASGEAETHAR